MSSSRGRLFIVSAPSGSGKTTLVERVVQEVPGLHRSRSYTSRAARPGEQDGVDYHFVTVDRFESMIQAGAFLEWANVFGNYYGTSAVDTEAHLTRGDDVVLVIDVQGATQVRERGMDAVGVFIMPPSAEVLEARLRGRSQDGDAAIRRRLAVARSEICEYGRYDYVVVNDEIDSAVARLKSIVLAERARVSSMQATADAIRETFRVAPAPAPTASGGR